MWGIVKKVCNKVIIKIVQIVVTKGKQAEDGDDASIDAEEGGGFENILQRVSEKIQIRNIETVEGGEKWEHHEISA